MNEMIWKKNMEAMKQRYPIAAETLEQKEQPEVAIGIDTVCEKKVLYAVKEGETYQLDTLYDSEQLMDMWYNNLPKIYFRSKILLFGLGNGMYVNKLLEKTADDVTIIVYEPTIDILRVVLKEFDISTLIGTERVHILINQSMDGTLDDFFSAILEFTDIEDFIYKSYLSKLVDDKSFVENQSVPVFLK